ncbi:MAG TPA: metal-dependent hydrolase [Candidatus Paceibacterota bacterium]|jgi:membrane-bound metal-dependent hydrolase YbcI (DUF457 family)
MPLDVGVGILLALGAAEAFGVEATPALVLMGVAATLLPDIDILTSLFGKWYHRTHTHFPITYIPLALAAFIFLDPLYATILTAGVFAHLIHDTFGIGWGIAWFWPFSNRKYLLFPEKGRQLPFGVLASWTPEEEAILGEAPRNAKWLKLYYFQPNIVAYIEYGVLLLALAVLAAYFG